VTINKIVIFNIETSDQSKYLSSNVNWIEAFSKIYSEVWVYSTHVGVHSLPQNVTVIRLGGGNALNRATALCRLIRASILILKERHEVAIFYHMLTNVPALLGKVFKTAGIRQGIWYSHSHADSHLKKAIRYCDYVFSPTQESFPLPTYKLCPVGHGVDSNLFHNQNAANRQGTISVGRVVPIKKLEDFITTFEKMTDLQRKIFAPFVIIGDTSLDPKYVLQLEEQAKSVGLALQIINQLPRAELSNYYNKANFYFMGTPKSIDKAAIEASMCGCIVLSGNNQDFALTGTDFLLKEMEQMESGSIPEQIEIYSKIAVQDLGQHQSTISQISRDRNDVKNLTRRISEKFNEG